MEGTPLTLAEKHSLLLHLCAEDSKTNECTYQDLYKKDEINTTQNIKWWKSVRNEGDGNCFYRGILRALKELNLDPDKTVARLRFEIIKRYKKDIESLKKRISIGHVEMEKQYRTVKQYFEHLEKLRNDTQFKKKLEKIRSTDRVSLEEEKKKEKLMTRTLG